MLSVICLKQGTDRLRGSTVKRREHRCCHGNPEFDCTEVKAKMNKKETLKGRLSQKASDSLKIFSSSSDFEENTRYFLF